LHAKGWKLQVGRIPLYLMDTDVASNTLQDQEFSARLHSGDHDIRLSQEIVLGIGGVRTLRAVGISPAAWHLNEGHAAFLNLERCRELVTSGLSFTEVREAVAANSLFTTHTPVLAGNDAFSYDLIDKYFGSCWGQLWLTHEQFVAKLRCKQVPYRLHHQWHTYSFLDCTQGGYTLQALLLTITTLLMVAIRIILPYTPLAVDLSFTSLPVLYFLFLAEMPITY
jgi:glucan phosphorylase